MNKKIWWVTRPTRDLHDVEDALKYFVKIALGKKWRGNRELHKKFDFIKSCKNTQCRKTWK